MNHCPRIQFGFFFLYYHVACLSDHAPLIGGAGVGSGLHTGHLWFRSVSEVELDQMMSCRHLCSGRKVSFSVFKICSTETLSGLNAVKFIFFFNSNSYLFI